MGFGAGVIVDELPGPFLVVDEPEVDEPEVDEPEGDEPEVDEPEVDEPVLVPLFCVALDELEPALVLFVDEGDMPGCPVAFVTSDGVAGVIAGLAAG